MMQWLLTWLRRVAEHTEIEVRYRLDRWWLPPEQARSLRALRRRLVAQPGTELVGSEEALLAAELRALRESLSPRFRHVEMCTSCARGHPPPAGRWPGGHCCSGKTVVFTEDELASLRLSGTKVGSLTPAGAGDGGCLFRGPQGCTLRPANRPNLCVRYVCTGLELELERRGNRAEIKAMGSQIRTKFTRFAELRAARGEDEFFGAFNPRDGLKGRNPTRR